MNQRETKSDPGRRLGLTAGPLRFALMWGLLAGPALGQEAPSAGVATEVEDVVVTGRSLRDAVTSFVDEIAAPLPGRNLSRWNRAVCVGVVNMRRDAAQALVDRVSSMALDVGLEPGEPGCRPNILIVASDDADALTQELVAMRPLAFRPPLAGAAGTRRALAEFVSAPRAVRWWHVSLPVDRETGRVGVTLPGELPRKVRSNGGLLTNGVRYDLRRTFVILDFERIEGVTIQQLGDYVGMVSLAQIDPEAETQAYVSILNLFDQPGSTPALTEWDRAYLEALYGSELTGRRAERQQGEIGALMARDEGIARDPAED